MNNTFNQAINAHKKGNFKEAERLYKIVLETNPKQLDATNNLGIVLENQRKFDEAETFYKKAIELKPDFAEVYCNLGNMFQKLNRLDEAEIKIKESIKLNPNFAAGYFNLGITLQKLKKLTEAKTNYQKAIELNSNNTITYINLGIVLYQLNEFEDAEFNFKKAINLQSNYAESYNYLGNTLLNIGKIDEAKLNFKKAIEIKPNFYEAYNSLGVLLYSLSNFDDAELNFKKAIEINPNKAIAHIHLGLTLKKLKKIDDSITSLNNALRLEPTNRKALISRGQNLFNKGDFNSALKDFDIINTRNSRAHALVSLYFLGRIEEIYKRIETNKILDERNLKVASFSSFISHKEKKETAHNFCNKPMDFINISNLSIHLKNPNLFINEVIEELKDVKTNWEPMINTTVNGYHSDGKINLFEHPSEKLKSLKSIILNEIDLYHLKFKEKKCSFIDIWPTEKNLYAWHVILKQQGYQKQHNHPLGWLSGVIYLKTVPPLKNNEGSIEFNLNGDIYSDKNSAKKIHEPKTGDIILFPSSLFHKTIPFSTNTDRIIVSFDLMPDKKNQVSKEEYM